MKILFANQYYDFHELLEDEIYIIRHRNDHISENAVVRCFTKVREDRNKVSTMSLGYRK